jgi:hypothetical protein
VLLIHLSNYLQVYERGPHTLEKQQTKIGFKHLNRIFIFLLFSLAFARHEYLWTRDLTHTHTPDPKNSDNSIFNGHLYLG